MRLRAVPRKQLLERKRATATLPLGVVGELEVQIATLPGFNQLSQFRLGEVWKT
jgi:hypothetical protein